MKALVLSSGGVDSTTALGMAIEKYGKENVTALSISYGCLLWHRAAVPGFS